MGRLAHGRRAVDFEAETHSAGFAVLSDCGGSTRGTTT
jgi:hypothetical protein